MQSSDDLESAFKHELCIYPSALFDSSLLLREVNKPALADAIWKTCECEAPADISEDGIQYVLDGGALLQRIPWSRHSMPSCKPSTGLQASHENLFNNEVR